MLSKVLTKMGQFIAIFSIGYFIAWVIDFWYNRIPIIIDNVEAVLNFIIEIIF